MPTGKMKSFILDVWLDSEPLGPSIRTYSEVLINRDKCFQNFANSTRYTLLPHYLILSQHNTQRKPFHSFFNLLQFVRLSNEINHVANSNNIYWHFKILYYTVKNHCYKITLDNFTSSFTDDPTKNPLLKIFIKDFKNDLNLFIM